MSSIILHSSLESKTLHTCAYFFYLLFLPLTYTYYICIYKSMAPVSMLKINN